MKKKNKKLTWLVIGIIIGIAGLIDIFVPDPIPFVDEIVAISLSLYGLYRGLK